MPGSDAASFRLRRAAESDAVLQISAVAWYEFCRGPRVPEHIAVARSLFADVVPFDETLAAHASEVFAAWARRGVVPPISQSA